MYSKLSCKMGNFMKIFTLTLVVLCTGDVNADKCCEQGQYINIINETDFSCWKNNTRVSATVQNKCRDLVAVRIGHPEEMYPDWGFYVNIIGQLILYGDDFETEYKQNKYCTGDTYYENGTERSGPYRTAVLCIDDDDSIIDMEIYSIVMFISAVLLLITASIYVALPQLRDLQGKSLICLTFSLGMAKLLLAIMRTVSFSDMNLCAARGFFAYFFLVAAFFWMNAVSIQILRCIRQTTSQNHSWREFGYYALYAWGGPAVLTLIVVTVNHAPGDHARPGIGLNHCWFTSTKQQWIYLYSVMTILIFANIGIFVYIASQLWNHTFSSDHIRAARYKAIVTCRLILVTGITWIFEMFTSILNGHAFWDIMDLVNCLQGVLIFLVLVVFRKRTLKAMYRNGWFPCLPKPIQRYLAGAEAEDSLPDYNVTQVQLMNKNDY